MMTRRRGDEDARRPDPVRPGGLAERRTEEGLPWLVRVRWGVAIGQLAAVGAGAVEHAVGPGFLGALPLIAVTGLSNLWLRHRTKRGPSVSPVVCGAVLVADTLVLTFLLHAGGGPSNPFAVLYLVPITLAAFLFGERAGYGLAALAASSYGLLFLAASPRPGGVHDAVGFQEHLLGMWAAFVLAAALTAYFVGHLTGEIERRDAEVSLMRERSSRAERLAAVTTLAASAAHELGTPLATIAVAAGELARDANQLDEEQASALREDARLIGSEVERCRRILDRMAAGAGTTTGEAPTEVSIRALFGDVIETLNRAEQSRVDVETSHGGASALLPRIAVASAIRNLVQNALDATKPPARVRLTAALANERVQFTVRDRGPGMPRDVLARAGEPFFSTKPHGRGMGLGLFLSRTIAEELDGRLELTSTPAEGTTAVLDFPLDPRPRHP